MFDDLQAMANLGANLGVTPENLPGEKAQRFERRDVLKLGLVGFLAASVPLISAKSAHAATGMGASWRVSLHHSHTGESFSGVYRVGDKYLPDVFKRLNYVLRDFRTREVFPMDPHVIDLISIIQSKTGTRRPLEILSGYRSPKTNAMLRNASTGVARNSLHMYGQAIDIRETDRSCERIRKVAASLRAGGVGYYPRSGFVHVDTGSVRSW